MYTRTQTIKALSPDVHEAHSVPWVQVHNQLAQHRSWLSCLGSNYLSLPRAGTKGSTRMIEVLSLCFPRVAYYVGGADSAVLRPCGQVATSDAIL